MFFLLRSCFWLGLVFYALAQRDGAQAPVDPRPLAAQAMKLCLAHAKTCAQPLAAQIARATRE